MISVVVCHRSLPFLEKFKLSLADTIGTDYELIVIDNSAGQYGICQAYNLGGAQARYAILCFVHEDILFHTANWGQNLLRHFENPALGALGVAGSKIFSKKWFSFGSKRGFGRINILQHTRDTVIKLEQIDPHQTSGTVVSLDGVFIACRREVFEALRFDEEHLRHFHCYDMDFSLRVSLAHEVRVAYDILIEHFSLGNYDERFAQEFRQHFLPKWRAKLPLYTQDFPPARIPEAEWYLFNTYAQAPMMKGKWLQLWSESLDLFAQYPRVILFFKIWLLILLNPLIVRWQAWKTPPST
jgi:hypothetical protein